MSDEDDGLAVAEDESVRFPTADVLTGRGFVTGKSGSGKSNTASVVAEELLQRGRGLLVVDTDAEYYGLAERYEMLTVGSGDHCDLDPREVEPASLAGLAVEENVPILFDVSELGAEADELLEAVLDALFDAEKTARHPYLVLVEEVHEFLPERGGSDDLSETLIRIAKRGRKRGLGICGLSQRPASVSKDFITQCDWLVWHRLTWDNDTSVVDRVAGSEAAEDVQSLADGEALVMADWEPSLRRVQFRRKHTTDSGATPDLSESRSTLPAIGGDVVARARREDAAGTGGTVPGEDDAAGADRTDLPVADETGGSGGGGESKPGDRGRRARRPAGNGGDLAETSPAGALAEVGDLVVHVVRFFVSSVVWAVDRVEDWLVDWYGVRRHGRLLARAVVALAFVVLFLLPLGLATVL
ncbi:ATP-binding protein [Haloarchaeobius baliensis]|uniref:ATP-binding protein n=1 Tax=Haloarchaeobius baliensis TaxID=1670458 RepID=UPI003F884371